MVTLNNECKTTKKGNDQRNIQLWFRAPRMWGEFLEAKSAEEFCSKSDLLRHAFRQFFNQELKQFVAHKTNFFKCKNYTDEREQSIPDRGSIITRTAAVDFFDLKSDPWFESMAAFVANKGSFETRRVYRTILAQFLVFVAKHPSKVEQSDIIRYKHELENENKAPSSIRLHLAAISGYYNFCISRSLTILNPTKGVSRPSVDSYTGSNWLNPSQAKHLIDQPDRQAVKGKRDYAILLTFLLTGLRRKELANVRRSDLQENDGKIYLTYTGKGGVKMIRDIPRRCWEAIQSYLAASGRKISDNSPIFTALANGEHHGGKNNSHQPITPEAIRQMVIHYSQKAFGDEIKVRPHTL